MADDPTPDPDNNAPADPAPDPEQLGDGGKAALSAERALRKEAQREIPVGLQPKLAFVDAPPDPRLRRFTSEAELFQRDRDDFDDQLQRWLA